MPDFLRRRAASVMASFWFMPAVMVLLAILSAFGTVALDRRLVPSDARHLGWIWTGGADGARSVMSTVARAQMTVVSVVFSIMIATMAQASSNYGSRVLRNFVADRGVQATLGAFLSTFAYCLLTLRTIRSVEESAFVPYVSINIGITLALTSLAVLIYFIHHVSQMIQAEPLIAGIGGELERLLPRALTDAAAPVCTPGSPVEMPGSRDPAVVASRSGYLQSVRMGDIVALATRHDALLRLEMRPGDFVNAGEVVLRIRTAGPDLPGLTAALRRALIIGPNRLPDQDLRYALQQLVEIAVRARSEPFTALICLEWLVSVLRRVLRGPPAVALHADASGTLRLVTPALDFADLADMVFMQIRLAHAGNTGVLLALMNSLGHLAESVQRASDAVVLLHQVRLAGECAQHLPLAAERQQVMTRLRSVVARIEACRDECDRGRP